MPKFPWPATFVPCLAGLLLLSTPSTFASPAPELKVESYYATSRNPAYDSMECVLRHSCQKGWSPESRDAGSLEGLYVRLERPFSFSFGELGIRHSNTFNDYILEVDAIASTHSADGAPPLTVFVDGKETPLIENEPAKVEVSNRIRSFRLANPEEGMEANNFDSFKTLFFRWHGLKKPPVVKGITLLRRLGPGEEKGIPAADVVERKTYVSDDLTLAPHLYQKLPFELPTLVKVTEAHASSQLEPTEAYQPANLFDHMESFAFSFNGKKNNGVGESLEFTFERPVSIASLRLANGYQRSKTHFASNGRVKELLLSAPGTPEQTVVVPDQFGSVDVKLPQPIAKAESLKLKIRSIYPGSAYPDLLISELAFLDSQNKLTKPSLEKMRPATKGLEQVVDRAWTSQTGPFPAAHLSQIARNPKDAFALTAIENATEFAAELRLRSNGTFVIYTSRLLSQVRQAKGVEARKTRLVDLVMEGNWAEEPKGLRIFGRKYHTARNKEESVQRPDDGGYSVLSDEDHTKEAEGIFQSQVKLRRFTAIPEAEAKRIVELLRVQHGLKTVDVKELKKANPLIFESGVLTVALTSEDDANQN